ncbi:hypothetical protein [Bradyrhizobium jicamae]|uniref:hypothetical protein n=1 Tax=Bradyrhizobium jicamae TaxID=280332 RepID=UPI001FDA31A6|nr:hypothetical protein [Bradyrhizobium jicamae]
MVAATAVVAAAVMAVVIMVAAIAAVDTVTVIISADDIMVAIFTAGRIAAHSPDTALSPHTVHSPRIA